MTKYMKLTGPWGVFFCKFQRTMLLPIFVYISPNPLKLTICKIQLHSEALLYLHV
uniref:Uncharacterized protein n=1 Tax=Octopus bimaculoides TaxID=37653 RepID=A0A0L8FVX1_OCTBM